MEYNKKVIKSGNHIRTIELKGRSISYGYKSNRLNYQKSEFGEKSKLSLRRTQDNLVQTIQCNVNHWSKFITLTTAETVLEREKFLEMFKVFKINFKRKFGYSLKYIGVLERQTKRGKKENNIGSLHIHMVVFNNQKIDFKKLKECWLYGSVDIKKVDKVENLGRYLGKYLTKDNIGIEKNKKAVFKSRGLKKPLISYDTDIPSKAIKTYHKVKDIIDEDTGEVLTYELTEYIISKNEEVEKTK